MYSKVQLYVDGEVRLLAMVKTGPAVDKIHNECVDLIRQGHDARMICYHSDGYGYTVRCNGRYNPICRPMPTCPIMQCDCTGCMSEKMHPFTTN